MSSLGKAIRVERVEVGAELPAVHSGLGASSVEEGGDAGSTVRTDRAKLGNIDTVAADPERLAALDSVHNGGRAVP